MSVGLVFPICIPSISACCLACRPQSLSFLVALFSVPVIPGLVFVFSRKMLYDPFRTPRNQEKGGAQQSSSKGKQSQEQVEAVKGKKKNPQETKTQK